MVSEEEARVAQNEGSTSTDTRCAATTNLLDTPDFTSILPIPVLTSALEARCSENSVEVHPVRKQIGSRDRFSGEEDSESEVDESANGDRTGAEEIGDEGGHSGIHAEELSVEKEPGTVGKEERLPSPSQAPLPLPSPLINRIPRPHVYAGGFKSRDLEASGLWDESEREQGKEDEELAKNIARLVAAAAARGCDFRYSPRHGVLPSRTTSPPVPPASSPPHQSIHSLNCGESGGDAYGRGSVALTAARARLAAAEAALEELSLYDDLPLKGSVSAPRFRRQHHGPILSPLSISSPRASAAPWEAKHSSKMLSPSPSDLLLSKDKAVSFSPTPPQNSSAKQKLRAGPSKTETASGIDGVESAASLGGGARKSLASMRIHQSIPSSDPPEKSSFLEFRRPGGGLQVYLAELETQVIASQGLVKEVARIQREGNAKLSELQAGEKAAQKRAAVAELRALELESLFIQRQIAARKE